jgi:hypothetical protein
MAKQYKTPWGILSFNNLFVPQPKGGVAGAKEVFSGNLIFDAAAQSTQDYKDIEAEVLRLIEELVKSKVPRSKIRNPLKDAGEKSYAGYGEGKIFISPSSNFKPAVIDAQRSPIIDTNDVWAGQRARFNINIYSYNNASAGVGLSLNGAQVDTDQAQERLDGRSTDAASMFSDDKVDPFAA